MKKESTTVFHFTKNAQSPDQAKRQSVRKDLVTLFKSKLMANPIFCSRLKPWLFKKMKMIMSLKLLHQKLIGFSKILELTVESKFTTLDKVPDGPEKLSISLRHLHTLPRKKPFCW